MPRSLKPYQKKRLAPSFYQLYQPLVIILQETPMLESRGDRLLQMTFEDQLKALIFFHLEEHIKEDFTPGIMSHMNPGSLSDWPITQQKILFSLFGDVEELIGVRLTESFLMDPIKSVSGIHFPTEFDFKSCMLCTRYPCVKRKAAYDPEMAKNYNKR